jgi:hypothetical protein
MTTGSRGRLAALAVLLLYGLLFVALSVDIIVRVWGTRFGFQTPVDAVALIWFEAMRALVTLAGLAIAAVAAARARWHPALLHLAFGLAFASIAYTKAMALAWFPGAGQAALARALLAADVPQWLLRVVFGHPEWAVWLALPPLLLLAARYPRPLTPDELVRNDGGDRTGAMRSVALAGADVGSIARTATAALLERGRLRARPLWLLGSAGAVLHTGTLIAGPAAVAAVVNIGAAIVIAAAAAVFLTLARAGLRAAPAGTAAPLLWLRRGAAAGMTLVALSAVAGMLPGGVVISTAAFSLAPAVVLGCVLTGLLQVGSAKPDDPDLVMVAQ